MNIIFLQFILGIVFLTTVYLNITKNNIEAVLAYCLQSLMIVILLFNSFLTTGSWGMLFVIFLIFIVKVISAPLFFTRLIRKHELTFSANTYLNIPLVLIVIAILTALAHAQVFAPLTNIIPVNKDLLAFALSSAFISLLLIIDRKGGLSQIIGILSFENSIVAFALFAGLEQSVALQLGIIFNIYIWLIIATGFMSMIYKHFGSIDVTTMRTLKD